MGTLRGPMPGDERGGWKGEGKKKKARGQTKMKEESEERKGQSKERTRKD